MSGNIGGALTQCDPDSFSEPWQGVQTVRAHILLDCTPKPFYPVELAMELGKEDARVTTHDELRKCDEVFDEVLQR
jgi:hypothetical protein